MSYEDRKQFLEQLSILSRSELEEVFRIIKRNTDMYSENTNGIFFDVAALREDTFTRLHEFMNFCIKNREDQKQYIETMNSIRQECITMRDIMPLETKRT